jgi:ADP-ribosylglycohydrolase
MNNLQTILLATATADALGVPVEFKSRAYLKENPVTDMQEYGTHHQPKGTWSDDTSLMLCLAESMVEGLDVNKLAQKFIAWKNDNLWTPHGWVFDIGIGTRIAIERLENGELPELAGGFDEMDNGNGSLMRILPLILFTKDLEINKRYDWTKKVSSITHAHVRSVMACFYYLESIH